MYVCTSERIETETHVCILVCAHLDHYYDILDGARQGQALKGETSAVCGHDIITYVCMIVCKYAWLDMCLYSCWESSSHGCMYGCGYVCMY